MVFNEQRRVMQGQDLEDFRKEAAIAIFNNEIAANHIQLSLVRDDRPELILCE